VDDHEEIQLQDAVEQAQLELEQQQAALTAKVEARTSALAEAQALHDGQERRLVTGQGDELVAAVKAMLERLEFKVDDRDETKKGQKLEDLRVSDPQSPWLALAEVKGYATSGGKPKDLAQLNRFVGITQPDPDHATRRWPVKCRRGHHGVQTRGARAANHGIRR
jgi:hypothetical protein